MKREIKSTVVDIHLQCSMCNKPDIVHTSKPELYKDYLEGEKKWLCIFCIESKLRKR